MSCGVGRRRGSDPELLWTPGQGTSICCCYSPKKKKKAESPLENSDYSLHHGNGMCSLCSWDPFPVFVQSRDLCAIICMANVPTSSAFTREWRQRDRRHRGAASGGEFGEQVPQVGSLGSRCRRWEFGEQVPQVGVWGAGLMSGFAGEGKSAYLFQFTGLAQTGSIKVRIKQSLEQNQGLGGRQGNSSRGSFPHSCLLVFKARLWE